MFFEIISKSIIYIHNTLVIKITIGKLLKRNVLRLINVSYIQYFVLIHQFQSLHNFNVIYFISNITILSKSNLNLDIKPRRGFKCSIKKI